MPNILYVKHINPIQLDVKGKPMSIFCVHLHYEVKPVNQCLRNVNSNWFSPQMWIHVSILNLTRHGRSLFSKWNEEKPYVQFSVVFGHHHHHLPPWIGRLTCSGIDALPSFPGASTVSSSSRFVVEAVFRESGVVHSFEVVDPVLFVFEFHVLYSSFRYDGNK